MSVSGGSVACRFTYTMPSVESRQKPNIPPYGALSGSPRSRPMRDAGDGRLSERRAEEGHAPGDDQVAHAAEDRREHEHAQEAADEKRILEVGRQQAALRQPADPAVERGHARATRRSRAVGSSSRTRAVARMSTRRLRRRHAGRGRSPGRPRAAPVRDRARPSAPSSFRERFAASRMSSRIATAVSSRPGRGLVEDQQLRFRIDRVREQHAPQFAAREYGQRPLLEAGQPDPRQQPRDRDPRRCG